MKRRKFTVEFKQEVVKEAIETNNCAMVARNRELSTTQVAKWVREYKNPIPAGLPLTKENKDMLKENVLLNFTWLSKTYRTSSVGAISFDILLSTKRC